MNARSLLVAEIALVLFLSPVLAEQPSVKPIEKPAAKSIVIPFETLKSGHMAVQIKVNGKGPYRVIFDTGAPINLLNNKLAKDSGLLKNAPKSVLPLLGTMAEVTVKKLEVGSAKAVDQHAIVMDHPLVELMSKKLGPLYGIVGFPFFGRYRMTIDYQAETLTLLENGYKPANVLRSMESTLMQLMTAGDQPPKVLSPAAQWGLMARKEADDDAAGLEITEVLTGSAAAEAGLKAGDRLLAIDGRWTDSLTDLFEIASHLKPGASVPISIKRADKEMELKIRLRAGL
jgi:hypothetical protein